MEPNTNNMIENIKEVVAKSIFLLPKILAPQNVVRSLHFRGRWLSTWPVHLQNCLLKISGKSSATIILAWFCTQDIKYG